MKQAGAQSASTAAGPGTPITRPAPLLGTGPTRGFNTGALLVAVSG